MFLTNLLTKQIVTKGLQTNQIYLDSPDTFPNLARQLVSDRADSLDHDLIFRKNPSCQAPNQC